MLLWELGQQFINGFVVGHAGGLVQLGDQGRYDEEIELYRQAISINPTFGKAFANLGVALAYVCMKKERPLEVAAEVTAAYHATNPLTGEEVPIWVADYVLATYGTAAG